MGGRIVNDDAHGNRTRITHPDGAFFEYAYDTADRLFHLSENGPSTTLASIFYDGEGRRDALARDALGATTGYGYDPISRLETLTHDLDGAGSTNDATLGFSYNPASQIVSRSLTNNAYEYPVASSTQSYAVNGRNQYTQVGGTTHSWDANGNLTGDGLTTFGYDTENRLVSASGAKNATLAYDPLGRLYQVTSGANTTRFVYDGDRLIAEYDGSGTLRHRYVHGAGIDEPLVWYEGASVSSATRRYLHANHQGSIVAVSASSGAMQQVRSYDAYGVTAADNTLRFQYTGQAAILELGLLYYKARFYNPALGRFMQTDPIGYEDDVNLYAYVRNDPLNRVDPTGTCGSRIEGAESAGCKSYVFATPQKTATAEQPRTSQSEPSRPPESENGAQAGGKLDYNGQTVRNPHVRDELAKLRAGLDAEGHSNVDLTVTGGESYYDAATGRSISLTDGSVIPDRRADSAHHVSNGARDVDLRRVEIPDADFRNAVRTHTNFNRITNKYRDGHWHLGLPRTYSCPPGVCTP